jgi:hypothetical protein
MEVRYYHTSMEMNGALLAHVPTLKDYYEEYRNYANIIIELGNLLNLIVKFAKKNCPDHILSCYILILLALYLPSLTLYAYILFTNNSYTIFNSLQMSCNILIYFSQLVALILFPAMLNEEVI